MRFTVRRLASAEVSPCCHRPSGGDVACSVHVGVARTRGASFAFEDRLALAVLGRDVPARAASLRRVRSRDLLDPSEGLVLQPCGEQPPSAVADPAVEGALSSDVLSGLLKRSSRAAGHSAHVECFDANGIEASRDICGGLFDPVLAAVGLTRSQPRYRKLRVGSPVGPGRSATKPLLQHLYSRRLTVCQPGDVKHFAGRQCRRNDNTPVNTHNAAVTWTDNRVRYVGERDVPASGAIAGDTVGLHANGNWSRDTEADPADLGYPHPAEAAVHTADVLRLNGDLPEPFVDAGFAPCRAAVRPGEKVTHRLGEVTQRLLLHRLGSSSQPPVLGAGSSQLSALLVVSGRAPSWLPVLLLLDGQIPHKPGIAAVRCQGRRLLSGRKKPVTRHAMKLATTTDKSPKGESGFPPLALARDSDAASIR